MFGKTFYPTPKRVIKKMLRPFYVTSKSPWGNKERYLDLSGKSILEPSAGRGDILDFIHSEVEESYYNVKPEYVFCIEKNDELRMILAEKGHRIIADDFLTLNTEYNFDLIIMNPPFNAGAKHLLKAWRTLISGDIVCLLNAETIKNPHTREKKLLAKIIQDNGKVEFIGNCFNGEGVPRKTNVEVAIVRLRKKEESSRGIHINLDKENLEFPKDLNNNIPAVRDVLLSYEHRYKAAVKAYKEMNEKVQEFIYLADGICEYKHGIKDLIKNYSIGSDDLNGFIMAFNEMAWQRVLGESKFERFLTTDVQRQFTTMFSKQAAYQFTKENMINMFNALWINKESIMEKCVEEVFDTFTKYYKENRCHVEGWVTNDMWKVNKKIILPYYIRYGEYCNADYLKSHGSRFGISMAYSTELYDIDRVMAYLKGVDVRTIVTITQALENHFARLGDVRTGEKFNNTTMSTYFDIKFWKKGTLHLEFRDEWLWAEFNKVATKCKNWLPPKQNPKRRKSKNSAA